MLCVQDKYLLSSMFYFRLMISGTTSNRWWDSEACETPKVDSKVFGMHSSMFFWEDLLFPQILQIYAFLCLSKSISTPLSSFHELMALLTFNSSLGLTYFHSLAIIIQFYQKTEKVNKCD